MQEDLQGKTIVVTGCGAQSIGEATAVALAQRGAKVLISTRQDAADRAAAIAALAAVPSAQIAGHSLDLLSYSSTAAFAAWVQSQTPQLSPDGQEIHWRCNYLGTAQLTFSLLPQLLAAAEAKGQARVVNVASMLHKKGKNRWLFAPQDKHDSWASYGTSKLALMHLSLSLHERYAGQGLKSYSLHPGAVSTQVADKGLQERPLLAGLRRALLPIERLFLLKPAQGAATSVHCATAADPASGLYWKSCKPAAASAELQDAAARQRLWEQTQAWLAKEST